MEVSSTFSADFYSDQLNQAKVDLLMAKAISLRDYRNEISEKIHRNMLKYLNFSGFDFSNEFYKLQDHCSSIEVQYAIKDVSTAYQNKLEAIKSKLAFRTIKSIKAIKYKKATKNHKPGDLKEIQYKRVSTNLTKCLTFLAKYDLTEEYIRNKTDFKTEKHKAIYSNVIYYLDKFGFDRLKALAEARFNNLLKRYNKAPIKFSSLTFTRANRTKYARNPIEKSNNSKQLWLHLTDFSDLGFNKSVYVPVKYSKKYHGTDLEAFTAGTCTVYTVQFLANKVRFIFTRPGTREITTNKTNCIGADVNLKHNLFATPEFDLDVDRDLLKHFAEFLPKYDRNKEKHEVKYKLWLRRFKEHLARKCSEFVDKCKALGKDHIVLEDIQAFGKMFTRDEQGTKYSRLSKILHLNDLKNMVISIANKKGIAVSLVHSHYTSQQCPICGCIDKCNRPRQEIFKCVYCGYTSNADKNASVNILNRVASNVLRESLLIEVYPGVYRPKVLSKEKIRSVLEDMVVQTELSSA